MGEACPDENALDAYARGEAQRRDAIEAHLAGCDMCRVVVATAAALATGGEARRVGDHPRDSLPTLVERYVWLDAVGEGSVGVVYAAYDRILDRKIAIKVLRAERGELDSDHRRRLLREGRALAGVVHPNVVAVYDAGVVEADFFIAMEFVAGGSLRSWLGRERRSPPAIVEVFEGALAGLAAIHAAGLVHRDFKPDNVLVTGDGTAKVTDFGLVRGSGQVPAADMGATPARDDDALGQTRALVGTPAYLAPELFDGGTADAASDQFAACVALFEALHGARPFPAKSIPELAERVRTGRPVVPKSSASPRGLQAIVDRGLHPDPKARHASVTDLAAALRRWRLGAGRRRRVLALGGVGAVVGVGAVAAGVWSGVVEARRTAACIEDGASIAAVWNRDRARHVRAGLAAVDPGYGDVAIEQTMARLDVYVDGWSQARRDACVAATVEDRWSADRLVRAQWCLDERRLALEALIDELADADAIVLSNAVHATADLPDSAGCLDAVQLDRLGIPSPDDVAAAQAIRARLSRVRARRTAGRYAEALAEARAALDAATEVNATPLRARARLELGVLLSLTGEYTDAERELEEAYFDAAAADRWGDAGAAALELVVAVGSRQARYRDGLRWSRLASLAEAAAPDPLTESDGLSALALLHGDNGDHDEAAPLLERSLAIDEAVLGPEHPRVASALSNLALNHSARGQFDDAKRLLERALALRERNLGAGHPKLGTALNNLAHVHQQMGHPEHAIPLLERSLAIARASFGSVHASVARALANVATAHASLGALPEAKRLFEESLAIYEETLGPNHPEVAKLLGNLGVTCSNAGDYAEAAAYHQRALAIEEERFGPDHPKTALTLSNLGVVYGETGDHDRAKASYARALEIQERELGPDHPTVAGTVHNLGAVSLASGQPEEAQRYFERALAISEKALGSQAPIIAQRRNDLARALEVQGKLEQARQLFEQAVAVAEHNERALALATALFGRARTDRSGVDAARIDARRALALFEAAADAKHGQKVRQWLEQHPERRPAPRHGAPGPGPR